MIKNYYENLKEYSILANNIYNKLRIAFKNKDYEQIIKLSNNLKLLRELEDKEYNKLNVKEFQLVNEYLELKTGINPLDALKISSHNMHKLIDYRIANKSYDLAFIKEFGIKELINYKGISVYQLFMEDEKEYVDLIDEDYIEEIDTDVIITYADGRQEKYIANDGNLEIVYTSEMVNESTILNGIQTIINLKFI